MVCIWPFGSMRRTERETTNNILILSWLGGAVKGLRYQKRIRVLPFLWVNISKASFSITIGNRFVKLNIGRRLE